MKHTSLLQVRQWLPCAAALCLIATTASAAVISQESFSGATGNLKGQQAPDWETAWAVPDVYINDSQVVAGSLSYPSSSGFASTGNQLAFSGAADRSVSADYNSAFRYQAGTDVVRYASVLINKPLHHYLLFQVSSDANRWSFGLNGSNQFLLRTSDGTNTVGSTSTETILADTTYLLVSKLVATSTGALTVYMNWYREGDLIPSEEPVSWMLSATTTNSETTVNSKLTILRGGGSGPDYIDEIRLGTEWNDVAAIPEPGTVALLGFGAAGAAFLRFRRLRRSRAA